MHSPLPSPSISTASTCAGAALLHHSEDSDTTFALSWLNDKSPQELISLLRSAYAALKEKERDLVLAAEIGRSLLESNIQLTSDCDSLLQPALPTPSTSYDLLPRHPTPLRHSTKEAMTEELQRKNSEINQQLDTVLAQQSQSDRAHARTTRQLQSQVTALRSSLQEANLKLNELDPSPAANPTARDTARDTGSHRRRPSLQVDRLLQKVTTLAQENVQVTTAKQHMEEQLHDTLKHFRRLQSDYEKVTLAHQAHQSLKTAYQNQFEHLHELNVSVQDHRHVLQRLQAKGVSIPSARSTSAASCHSSQSQSMAPLYRQTLLAELETEWHQNHAKAVVADKNSMENSMESSMENSLEGEDRLGYTTPKLWLDSVLSKVGGMDPYMLEETLRYIHQLEEEHDVDQGRSPSTQKIVMPTPQSLMGKVYGVFWSLWSWFRFVVVLMASVLFSLWNGPKEA
ncbi:hypothetical protein BDF14DRAFT_1717632 [Spinellus fusiger]|nr:hypothetical protein BDF14DRAFT_1717632 [Spinellus fusiger]